MRWEGGVDDHFEVKRDAESEGEIALKETDRQSEAYLGQSIKKCTTERGT